MLSVSSISPRPAAEKKQNDPGQASLTSLQDEQKLIERQTRESEKELNRILRNVDYDDIKMFSRELSWIFRQCVSIESSKLKAGDETDKAHWRTIYNFVETIMANANTICKLFFRILCFFLFFLQFTSCTCDIYLCTSGQCCCVAVLLFCCFVVCCIVMLMCGS